VYFDCVHLFFFSCLKKTARLRPFRIILHFPLQSLRLRLPNVGILDMGVRWATKKQQAFLDNKQAEFALASVQKRRPACVTQIQKEFHVKFPPETELWGEKRAATNPEEEKCLARFVEKRNKVGGLVHSFVVIDDPQRILGSLIWEYRGKNSHRSVSSSANNLSGIIGSQKAKKKGRAPQIWETLSTVFNHKIRPITDTRIAALGLEVVPRQQRLRIERAVKREVREALTPEELATLNDTHAKNVAAKREALQRGSDVESEAISDEDSDDDGSNNDEDDKPSTSLSKEEIARRQFVSSICLQVNADQLVYRRVRGIGKELTQVGEHWAENMGWFSTILAGGVNENGQVKAVV
jgi:hypothetical protein